MSGTGNTPTEYLVAQLKRLAEDYSRAGANHTAEVCASAAAALNSRPVFTADDVRELRHAIEATCEEGLWGFEGCAAPPTWWADRPRSAGDAFADPAPTDLWLKLGGLLSE